MRAYDTPGGLSRRDMLALLGLVGTGTAATCACGGLAGLLWWMTRDRDDPDSPTPAPDPSTLNTPEPEFLNPRPQIVPRAAWGAHSPDHSARNESGFYTLDHPEGWRIYDGALQDAYQTVVIHHSVDYEGDDLSTLLEIQRAHRVDRGWADVGYHYLVGKDGLIYEGRDINARGTHVAGYNTGSAGVCLLGNFMTDTPGEAQLLAAQSLVMWLAEWLRLTHLGSHRDFNPQTLCPGDNLSVYIDWLAESAALARGIEGYIPPPEQLTPEASALRIECPCCGGTLT